MNDVSTKVVEPVKKKRTPPAAGRGRVKGSLNKNTAQIKDMILEALHGVGGVEYLMECATNDKSKGAFLGLVGKVLPMTVAGDPSNPLITEIVIRVADAD